MSLVNFHSLSLKEVADGAELVLTVKRSEPFLEKKEIQIGNDPLKKYPVFIKTGYHFVVTGRLDTLGGRPEIGEKITAVDGNFGRELETRRLYHLENISKSPIYEKYETRAELLKDDELILFISLINKDEYIFSAYESIAKKEEIKKLLETAGGHARPIFPEPADLPKKPFS